MGKRFLYIWLVLLGVCIAAVAKDKPLAAIVLYPGEAGPAYVQLNDFLINGGTVVAVCTADDSVTGNSYKRFSKAALAAGAVLEREAGGRLTLTASGVSSCALPFNLKLDKNRTYSLKEVADLSTISGAPVSKSSNAGEKLPTNFLPGTQIYIVEATDTELAEFLRAQRAQTIPLWEDYLKLYAGAAHGGQARKSLAALIVAEGQDALAAYKQTSATGSPAYERLKAARLDAEKALKLIPEESGASKLRLDVDTEFQAILAAVRAELNAFLTALNEHTAGFDHLGKAQAQLDHAITVDPAYGGADKLKADIYSQKQGFDNTLTRAEAFVAQKQFDQAYDAILRYKSFQGEVPRIAAVVDAAFIYRRDRGRQAAQDGKWEAAIAECKRALEYRTDADTAEALKRAETELKNQQNARATEAAMGQSQARALAKQFVEAYQVLEALPDAQRTAAVTAEMDKLKGDYVADLIKRANALARVHVPLRGPADEDGGRQAHDFMSRAAALSDDEGIKFKLDGLSDQVTDYYSKKAKRLLEKPRSSGVALGWLLLKEAERYRPDNEDTRNQLARYAPEFDTRAKLSVAVQFRDQTSRRDSPGFADQLSAALITGLESSGLPGIKVFSVSEEADPAGGPAANLLMVGNIGQHRVEKNIEQTSLTSRYRETTRDVRNPEWQVAKRELDDLSPNFEQAKVDYNRALGRAGNNVKKKEVIEAQANLDAVTKKIAEARSKLDGIPETKLEAIIQPYNYTKRTYRLNAIIDVSFRLEDPGVQTPMATDVVKLEIPRTAVVLENVNPKDVDGVVAEGTPPDESQLLTEAEIQARQQLINKVTRHLADMQPKILQQARALVESGDLESAAEKYVLYLNSTPAKDTQERSEARQFLREKFKISSAIVQ